MLCFVVLFNDSIQHIFACGIRHFSAVAEGWATVAAISAGFGRDSAQVLGGSTFKLEATKASGSTSCDLNHPKMAEASEMMLHQVELPAVSCSNLNILQIKSTVCADPMDWASRFSSKAVAISQNISEDANLNKSASAQGVLSHFANVAGGVVSNFPNHIASEGSEKSKIKLWSGNPPKWIEKFEVSNCLILNLIAQLYRKFGADGLLSPILQSLISLYPVILGSGCDVPAESNFDLCELLLQYIDHKIDSDIEELYVCCRLLERLTTMSNFFSEVYSAFLPPLQISVSENYGGTLQLPGRGD